MGNVTVSTDDTEIYYPSDLLAHGGPPYEVMGCPEVEPTTEQATAQLSIIMDMPQQGEVWWKVCYGDLREAPLVVVMESRNPINVALYLEEYMLETVQELTHG